MSLSKHIDPDELVASLRNNSSGHSHGHHNHRGSTHHFTYGSRYSAASEIPKFRLPQDGTDAATVHQLIKDELDLDGRPNLNLASFVHTWMEPHADQLMMENINKNLSDADEYPALMAIHARCISMISHLWNIPKGQTAIGTATTGSSEAIHLGGLAMKRRWQEKRRKEGKSTEKPNILMGANAQVALEKFARYFEVEARILPVSAESQFCLSAKEVAKNIDENTIGVFVILGSTYTGHFEPVEEVSKVLDEYESQTGISIPIHVDGASGAFVAPFSHTHEQKWGFELPRVVSINTSGHKFGLVYPGLGWIVWRSEEYLPKELIFELHYLGGTEQSYTLNFSRPGAQVVAQYFNFIHLGIKGYKAITHNDMANARFLSNALERTGWYTCLSDIHRKKGTYFYNSKNESSDSSLTQKVSELTMGSDNDDASAYNPGLPVVAFRFSDKFKKDFPHVKQQSVSTLLRAKQYIIPNYALPPNEQDTEILRVVVRESMSADLLDRLIGDIVQTTETLMSSDEVDLEAFGMTAAPRVEKVAQSMGEHGEKKRREKQEQKKNKGILSSTC